MVALRLALLREFKLMTVTTMTAMTERYSPAQWYKRAERKTPEWSPLDANTSRLDPTLPHGAQLCAKGLVLPEKLEFDEWLTIGKKLIEIEKGMQWALGEWWAFGHYQYGARAKAAEKLPYAFGTLANLGWVARAVPASSRNEVLEWSHHKAVAKLSPLEQEHWLEKAAKEDWSSKALEKRIRESDRDDRTEADERLKQNDPDEFRKQQSHKTAIDAIYQFGKLSANCALNNAVQAITTDPQLLADLADRVLARLLSAASGEADMFNEVVAALEQEQERRAKPRKKRERLDKAA